MNDQYSVGDIMNRIHKYAKSFPELYSWLKDYRDFRVGLLSPNESTFIRYMEYCIIIKHSERGVYPDKIHGAIHADLKRLVEVVNS